MGADQGGAPPKQPVDRRLIALAVVGGIVLLGVAITKRSLDEYARTDPDFCRPCHEARIGVSLWTDDAHTQLACQECHVLAEDDVLRMLSAFVRTGTTAPHASQHVADSRCEACHLGQRKAEEETLMRSPGHWEHLRSGLVACRTCHGSRAHGIVEPDTKCAECHEQAVQTVGTMGLLHCPSCHNFLDPGKSILPSRKDCQDCHDARRIKIPDVGPGDHMATLPCWSCHDPHRVDTPGTSCEGCHRSDATTHGHQIHAENKCLDCHVEHTFDAPESVCKPCHEMVSVTEGDWQDKFWPLGKSRKKAKGPPR